MSSLPSPDPAAPPLAPPADDHAVPGAWASALFSVKTRLLQFRRWLMQEGRRPARHAQVPVEAYHDWPVHAEVRGPLWGQITPGEFHLTAGKVHNLRLCARQLHGLRIPAGQVFSFWAQIGRTTRSRGYVAGRELREGCLIPNRGGGLCLLSGLLYGAVLDAGLQIVERHGHSRTIPGSMADQGRDATVFWNYVDLQIQAPQDWVLEVTLSATELIVRIRTEQAREALQQSRPKVQTPASLGEPARAAPSGDCVTCGMVSCFRHPGAVAAHGGVLGHTAFLLDARWPELDRWCGAHARPRDPWHLPLDGRRWRKANYAWQVPPHCPAHEAAPSTLWRSWQQRRLPGQGAIRQRTLLLGDEALARRYAQALRVECRHVVVSQNLLPYLWRSGVLGGRSFDVLLHRWPLLELQRRLDTAALRHPESDTLGDFRADPALAQCEQEALEAAARLITPHRALASHFGSRSLLVDWDTPAPLPRSTRPAGAKPMVYFPASALGRKGVYEVAEALRGLDVELVIQGRATEGAVSPLQGLRWRGAGPGDLAAAAVVILPAWVEHQPRVALVALASDIPVIATQDCGLPDHPRLHRLIEPDPMELRARLVMVLQEYQTTKGAVSIGDRTMAV